MPFQKVRNSVRSNIYRLSAYSRIAFRKPSVGEALKDAAPMSAESQFWWNWWVSLGAAIATLAAVLVALFGDWIKARLFSPKLVLSLRNATGERTTVTLQWQTEQGLQQRIEEARYYHVRVSNQQLCRSK